MKIDRRDWLRLTAAAGAGFALAPYLQALPDGALIRRAIPSSGERLPAVGLGSSATFSQVARGEDASALREVIKVMIDRGATVIDTAPAYGASEQVAGAIANDLGVRTRSSGPRRSTW